MALAQKTGGLDIRPSGGAIGAELYGVDLRTPLSDAAFAAIEATFHAHGVLCIRDQDLTEDQYLAFVRRFGPVKQLFLENYAKPGWPDILLVSNIQENGRNIGHADAGRVWHTDMSYLERPARVTLLHAKEVPVADDGTVLGDTLFASAAAAYESLDAPMRARLDGLQVVHHLLGRRAKTKTGQPEDDAKRAAMPDILHPFVRTHAYTGRKCLYVCEGECVGVEGMPQDEALDLIAAMAQRIVRPEYQYRHKWRVGDVLLWDNCAVQHLALADYALPQRRLMWRSTVEGERPV
ncbi:MAG: TauD/TfdA dioxygenase family protein [Alphaproteobacteria bacterium]